MIILLMVFPILLFLLFLSLRRDTGRSVFFVLLKAVSVFFLAVYLLTYVLSAATAITRKNLIFCYGALLVILVLLLLCLRRSLLESLRDSLLSLRGIDTQGIFLILAAVLFSAGMLYLSVKTTPYNYDSMTYHLPRIAQWAQNHSVAHYATHDIRQVTSPVLAEYVNLHVYLLDGYNDRFFNVLQCACFLLSAAGVLHLSRRTGCSRQTAFVSVLLYLACPIVFSEALNTQVDVVAGVFGMGFVAFLLPYLQGGITEGFRGRVCEDSVFLGLFFALGYLAKPSVLFIIMSFSIVFIVISFRNHNRLKQVLPAMVTVLLLALLLVLPVLMQNIGTLGAVSDREIVKKQFVDTLHPLYLLVNFLKNLASNLPSQYSSLPRRIFLHGVPLFARLIGVNVNDPSITDEGLAFDLDIAGNYNHDTAVNPLLTYLFIFALVALPVIRKLGKKRGTEPQSTDRLAGNYIIATTVSFLLLLTFLHWTPFLSRFLCANFLLICPMIGITLQRIRGISVTACTVFSCIIILLGGKELFQLFRFHAEIARTSRPESYYLREPSLLARDTELAEHIKEQGYEDVAFVCPMYLNWEYPLRVLLKDAPVRFSYIDVNNATAVHADPSYVPDAIITFYGEYADTYRYGDRLYREIVSGKNYALFGIKD